MLHTLHTHHHLTSPRPTHLLQVHKHLLRQRGGGKYPARGGRRRVAQRPHLLRKRKVLACRQRATHALSKHRPLLSGHRHDNLHKRRNGTLAFATVHPQPAHAPTSPAPLAALTQQYVHLVTHSGAAKVEAQAAVGQQLRQAARGAHQHIHLGGGRRSWQVSHADAFGPRLENRTWPEEGRWAAADRQLQHQGDTAGSRRQHRCDSTTSGRGRAPHPVLQRLTLRAQRPPARGCCRAEAQPADARQSAAHTQHLHVAAREGQDQGVE